TMADVNVNARAGQAPAMAPPVRTGDQILPRIRWVPIGKSNCHLDLDKSQSNPIYNIVRKHKFHPRPDSPLYLPNEEHVLGYLKFSAKGTKREVFGMPIPGSDQDSHAPKPNKPARKPKLTAPKAPPRPPVASAQPEPASTPAESLGKKRKLTTETSIKPSRAKKSKYSVVPKIRKLMSTLKSVAEDVHAKEPQVDAEDAYLERALEESLKKMHDVPRGPLPPVVIRESKSEKYQPLLEVPRKGKKKVTGEQVAHDLLSLQKPKKKSPTDQYTFQRHTSIPTGSSRHNESLYAENEKSDSEEESKKVMTRADEAGSNPGEQSKGQAGQDPGNTGADEQSMPSPMVHAGSNCEHMDLDVPDVSPQPSNEQMDEGFTATAYLKVQENLKLTVKEQVLLEVPVSSSRTLSSLQHLSKDISFGDLFFSDKPLEADNDKTNVETKVESMVSVIIQQDMSSIPPMTSPIIDLTSRPESPKNKGLEERLDSHGGRLYTLERLDIPHQVSKAVNKVITDTVDWAMQAPLRNRFRDLPEADMKEILYQRMWELNLTNLMKITCSSTSSSSTSRPSGASGAPGASRSSQVPPPLPPPSSTNQDNLQMDEYMALDEQAQSSNDEDIGSAHIPKVNLRQDWWKPLEEERPATPKPAWSIPSSDVPVMLPRLWTGSARDEELLSLNLETWKALHLKSSKSFILIYQSAAFRIYNKRTRKIHESVNVNFNEILEMTSKQFSLEPGLSKLNEMGKSSNPSVSKVSEASRKDLEDLFQDFYDEYFDSSKIMKSSTTNVETSINEEVFHEVSESFQGESSLFSLNDDVQQGPEEVILPQTNTQSISNNMILNADLTKPQWDATGFEYKYDYTVIDSTRALMLQDRYRVQMMMHFNEIHKFSDGTLQQINEAMDYRVKEFRINRINLGLNMRFWTRKDVDRNKAFMFAIQKRLKTKRVFRNLESFIDERVRDEDYRNLKRIE
nr:hypothetical protein [Tanacetum cinerariifolium]